MRAHTHTHTMADREKGDSISLSWHKDQCSMAQGGLLSALPVGSDTCWHCCLRNRKTLSLVFTHERHRTPQRYLYVQMCSVVYLCVCTCVWTCKLKLVCVRVCAGAQVCMTLPFWLIGKCQQGPMCQYYVQMPVMIREKGNYHYGALELYSSWLLKKKNDLNTHQIKHLGFN